MRLKTYRPLLVLALIAICFVLLQAWFNKAMNRSVRKQELVIGLSTTLERFALEHRRLPMDWDELCRNSDTMRVREGVMYVKCLQRSGRHVWHAIEPHMFLIAFGASGDDIRAFGSTAGVFGVDPSRLLQMDRHCMLGDGIYEGMSMRVAKCLLQQPDKKDDQ